MGLDEMPYQNDPDAIAEDLFAAIPKFSELMPSAAELSDDAARAKLPALRAKYQADEAAALERMRRPNPLLDGDWGKSRNEIIAEAKALKEEDDRKKRLMSMLDDFQKEDELRGKLRAAKGKREEVIHQILDAGVK